MSGDVVLSWRGREHRVPADRVLRLGADLEDMLSSETISAWERLQNPRRFNINLLCMAYGHALRFAGAAVTDLEVRTEMFSAGEMQAKMAQAVEGIFAMMAPPVEFAPPPGDDPGNPPPPRRRRGSSGKRS
jgi:hypothetical protein